MTIRDVLGEYLERDEISKEDYSRMFKKSDKKIRKYLDHLIPILEVKKAEEAAAKIAVEEQKNYMERMGSIQHAPQQTMRKGDGKNLFDNIGMSAAEHRYFVNGLQVRDPYTLSSIRPTYE